MKTFFLGLARKSSILAGMLAFILLGCASSDHQTDCGRVSTYMPPEPEQYRYRVVVTHLNGQPVISRPNYRLSPGTYEFTVAELINSPELKVALSARGTKTISVTVEANQRYHLGAKMKTDKIYVGRNKNFWEPVIFAQEVEECQMPVR